MLSEVFREQDLVDECVSRSPEGGYSIRTIQFIVNIFIKCTYLPSTYEFIFSISPMLDNSCWASLRGSFVFSKKSVSLKLPVQSPALALRRQQFAYVFRITPSFFANPLEPTLTIGTN